MRPNARQIRETADYGRPIEFTSPDWAKPYRRQEDFGVVDRVFEVGQRDETAGFWWVGIGHPYDQVVQAETVKDELLGHVLGVWDFLKNHGPQRDRLRTFGLEWIGMLAGKRESRRLMGDVILAEHHARVDQRWPDRIGHAGWYTDQHAKGGILNTAGKWPPSADR